MTELIYSNLNIIAPDKDIPYTGSIVIKDGLIKDIGSHIKGGIDMKGLALLPAIVDLRVNLSTQNNDLCDTLKIAAKSGITTVVAQPDTTPILDCPEVINSVMDQGRNILKTHGGAKLLINGALTNNLDSKHVAQIGLMREVGIVGLSNGNNSIFDTLVLLRVFQYASMFDLTVHMHPMDYYLANKYDVSTSFEATKLGLKGTDPIAEELEIRRLVTIASKFKVPLHLSHISTLGAIKAISEAKAEGKLVSADVCHHHITLNESSIDDYRTHTKIIPPLRSEIDRLALINALKDGTIDCIVSDHKTRSSDLKRLPFCQASFGATGLQTLLPFTLKLVENGFLSINQAIRCISSNPAKVAKIKDLPLTINSCADFTIVDLNKKIELNNNNILGKYKNTPYENYIVKGKIVETFIDGIKVYDHTNLK